MYGFPAHPALLLLWTGLAIVVSVSAAPPPRVKVVASQRRNDLTGDGSVQRIGMLRQQQRVQRMIEKQTQTASSKKK